jgi:hypothetical protein
LLGRDKRELLILKLKIGPCSVAMFNFSCEKLWDDCKDFFGDMWDSLFDGGTTAFIFPVGGVGLRWFQFFVQAGNKS